MTLETIEGLTVVETERLLRVVSDSSIRHNRSGYDSITDDAIAELRAYSEWRGTWFCGLPIVGDFQPHPAALPKKWEPYTVSHAQEILRARR